MQEEIQEYLSNVKVALAVTRHQTPHGVRDLEKTKAWDPTPSIEVTTGLVVDHPNVEGPLQHGEVL